MGWYTRQDQFGNRLAAHKTRTKSTKCTQTGRKVMSGRKKGRPKKGRPTGRFWELNGNYSETLREALKNASKSRITILKQIKVCATNLARALAKQPVTQDVAERLGKWLAVQKDHNEQPFFPANTGWRELFVHIND